MEAQKEAQRLFYPWTTDYAIMSILTRRFGTNVSFDQ